MVLVRKWGLDWEDGRTPEEAEAENTEKERHQKIMLELAHDLMNRCLAEGLRLESAAAVKKHSFWTDNTSYFLGGRVVPDTAKNRQRVSAIMKMVIANHRDELATFIDLD